MKQPLQLAEEVLRTTTITSDSQFVRIVTPYMVTGRYIDAHLLLTEGLKRYPDNVQLLSQMAMLCLRTGDHYESLNILTKCLKINEKNAGTHYQIAEVYAALDRDDVAETHLNRSIELNPDHEIGYLALNDLYLREKRNQESFKLTSEMTLRWGTENSVTGRALARYHLCSGDSESGRRVLEPIFFKDGEKADLRTDLALMLAAQKKWKEAEDIVRPATRMRPGDIRIQETLFAVRQGPAFPEWATKRAVYLAIHRYPASAMPTA